MKSVILISENRLDVESLAKIGAGSRKTDIDASGRFVAVDDSGWFAIVPGVDLSEDYDSDRFDLIHSKFSTPSFALLEFTTSASARAAIEMLSRLDGLWIDNDHGVFAPVSEVLARAESDPAWYYAKS